MNIARLADRMTAETEKIIYGKREQIRLFIMKTAICNKEMKFYFYRMKSVL